MNFNPHYNLKNQHSFLAPSKISWLNYDNDKLILAYQNQLAIFKGTELHEFAASCIKLGQKLPRSNKTLNMYVNDAIGYKMTPEQILYYSDNCFGTTDAICFRDNKLRIHDLKTGAGPAHIEQLKIYAALFCLEYDFDPTKIDICLRMYQFNDFEEIESVPPEEVSFIMGKIIAFDRIINKLKSEEA